MSELTAPQKREVTERLGYRCLVQNDGERFEVIGPEGRHYGFFRPSRATDAWIWNDAAYRFELYLDPEGAVHRRRSFTSDGSVLERVWPEGGEPVHVLSAELGANFEWLSSGPWRASFLTPAQPQKGATLG